MWNEERRILNSKYFKIVFGKKEKNEAYPFHLTTKVSFGVYCYVEQGKKMRLLKRRAFNGINHVGLFGRLLFDSI